MDCRNRKRGNRFLVLAAAAALMALPAAQAAQPAAPGGERVSVLVHLESGADRAPVREFVARQGGRVHYEYKLLPNVINLRGIPVAAVSALEQVRGVMRVEEDKEVHAHHNDSTPLVRGLQSQITGAGLSADGGGVRVCVIDTGIDSDHVMYTDRIDTAAGRDFVNGDNDPEDDNGHGSHVSGSVLGGTGLTVDFGCVGPEPFQGLAPEATLIGVKVLSATGSGTFSDVIAGIDYCADQSPSGGRADVINMSLGGGSFSGTCDSDTAAAASNAAVDAGVVVVASSGNEGQSNAMGTPACGSKVIAVGATYDDDFPSCEFPNQSSFTFCTTVNRGGICTGTCTDDSPSVDQIGCYSNGSTELDVVAPGCITFSADKDNSPSGLVGFCGTSMASPHVAGLAALLLSADVTLAPADVRQAIRGGAVDLGASGFDTVFGHGRIDAINSLNLLSPAACGDGSCNGGEDSCSCATDCGAPPASETSCTDGVDNDCDGLIDCDDADCGADPACAEPFCGDGSCDSGEDQCSCATDCGSPPTSETSCSDGADNDCDGFTDGDDTDCQSACADVGASCSSDADCCSNKCRGRSGAKTCKS